MSQAPQGLGQFEKGNNKGEVRGVERDDDDDAPPLSHEEDSDSSASTHSEEEEDWNDAPSEGEEEEEDPSLCLFCTQKLPHKSDLLVHLRSSHSFDYRSECRRLGLGFYQQMKIINFIREQMSKGVKAEELVKQLTDSSASSSSALSFLYDDSDAYLKPFLQEDPLLFSLPKHSNSEKVDNDEEEEEEEDETPSVSSSAPAGSSPSAPSLSSVLHENERLNERLESMTEAMRTMQETLRRMVTDRASAEEEKKQGPALSSSSSSSTAVAASSDSSSSPGSFAPDHVDRDYFGGYSTRNIHELMLRDTIRTEAYRDFMYGAAELFKDKIVLDVGCGTGILSMFAAKMGAKKVIGVDAADIVHKAREIVAANGFSGVIEIVHGKMEEVTLPVVSTNKNNTQHEGGREGE